MFPSMLYIYDEMKEDDDEDLERGDAEGGD
jgi:hypothetical protein